EQSCHRNSATKLWPRLHRLQLRPLHAAERFESFHDLRRPLCYLVVAQRALAGLELGAHQDRVLARANFFAAENFCRDETAQLGDAQSVDALVDLLELHALIKNKGEVALDGREARQRFITHLAQIVLVEPVEIDLGHKNILAQFAGRGYIGMNLAKLGNRRAIHYGASRASGMIVIRGLGIVVERPMAEGSEQVFDVALQIEERQRTLYYDAQTS